MTLEGFTPINGYILIRVLDEVEKEKGGLILPETSTKERGNIAVVENIGYNDGGPVSVGSKIMFSKYSGTIIQDRFSPVEHRLIKLSDILGIFSNTDDS